MFSPAAQATSIRRRSCASGCTGALEDREVPDEVWEQNGRFFDPFRPVAEPDGFASREELLIARAQTLDAFRRSVTDANVFVFTLGLTERWLNRAGYEYPMCPGTAAGNFDETAHVFDNLDFARAREALAESIAMMRRSNPNLKFILTVSPVPLTATYSGKNVLVATMQSKSVLRAVAGQLADRAQYIDYFPSYEIINSPVYKGAFFEPNMRSVTAHGVGFVMDTFFASQKAAFGVAPTGVPDSGPSAEQIVCEEELLEKFGAAK